ncbi:hypothetical protein D9M68_556870 [compost metagenome]
MTQGRFMKARTSSSLMLNEAIIRSPSRSTAMAASTGSAFEALATSASVLPTYFVLPAENRMASGPPRRRRFSRMSLRRRSCCAASSKRCSVAARPPSLAQGGSSAAEKRVLDAVQG